MSAQKTPYSRKEGDKPPLNAVLWYYNRTDKRWEVVDGSDGKVNCDAS